MNVEIDHLDAPVFYDFTISEFESLLAPFDEFKVVPERFPVATKVHSGLSATLYNRLFVGLYNALPHFLIRKTGHHLLAFACKNIRT